MIARIRTIYDKLAFCYAVSGSASDFLRLIINSKKYTRASPAARPDPPVMYRLKPADAEKKIMLRTYAGDIEMFYETFWRGIYNNPGMDWDRFTTIVDLGANIGMTALFFTHKSPGATVYAVEPDPDNFELLTANLSYEISDSRLIPVQAAITAINGPVYLHKKQKAYNSSVSDTEQADISVRGMNMSTFFREMYINEIDLLKIDIEGKEAELFSGETDWLQKVSNIVMECHSEKIRTDAAALLIQYGFTVYSGNNNRNYADILWASR